MNEMCRNCGFLNVDDEKASTPIKVSEMLGMQESVYQMMQGDMLEHNRIEPEKIPDVTMVGRISKGLPSFINTKMHFTFPDEAIQHCEENDQLQYVDTTELQPKYKTQLLPAEATRVVSNIKKYADSIGYNTEPGAIKDREAYWAQREKKIAERAAPKDNLVFPPEIEKPNLCKRVEEFRCTASLIVNRKQCKHFSVMYGSNVDCQSISSGGSNCLNPTARTEVLMDDVRTVDNLQARINELEAKWEGANLEAHGLLKLFYKLIKGWDNTDAEGDKMVSLMTTAAKKFGWESENEDD
jgi:hypothetical protein